MIDPRAFWKAPSTTACFWLSISGIASAADCEMPRFHFVDEDVTVATMSVIKNTGCKFHFEYPNSVFGSAGIMNSTITVRPANGKLGKANARIYAYKPNDDFVGKDEFEIK